jgi:hypothetical protein
LVILPPIGTTRIVHWVRAESDFQSADTNKEAVPRSEELASAIRAFTLADGAAPVLGVCWVEFVDPDLALAEVGRMWMSPNFEGMLGQVSPLSIDTASLFWVDRYLSLKVDVKSGCDVALDRLNLARRRQSAGNKAIEGAICLEALLGGDGNQELTYKLRLRAALLLSFDVHERRRISRAVRDFFTLRSKTVHGERRNAKDVQKDDACARDGLDICAGVVRVVVAMNRKFVPEDWELSGGQPEPPASHE